MLTFDCLQFGLKDKFVLSLHNIVYLHSLQYGRIVDIDLKLPPRPPGFCFVEVCCFVYSPINNFGQIYFQYVNL